MDVDLSDLNPPDSQGALSWAETEFATLDCGDTRRDRRFVRVASDFIRNPTAAIPAACGGGAGLLMRSQHDRKLEDGGSPLWQIPVALPVTAALVVELPRGKQGLKARKASLAVRAGRVRLAVPAHKKKYLGLSDSIELWALEVREIDPPPGVEPVCWQLLTTEPVADAADAARLVGWYALRWLWQQSGSGLRQSKVICLDSLRSNRHSPLVNALAFLLALALPLAATTISVVPVFEPLSMHGTDVDEGITDTGEALQATVASRPMALTGALPEILVESIRSPHKFPTNNPNYKVEEVNLLILCNIGITAETKDDGLHVELNVATLNVPEGVDLTGRQVLKLALVAIRKTLEEYQKPQTEPLKVQVSVTGTDEGTASLQDLGIAFTLGEE